MSADTKNPGHRRPPQKPGCKHCGGEILSQNLLDSREGKSFRLGRCFRCEKLSWPEESGR